MRRRRKTLKTWDFSASHPPDAGRRGIGAHLKQAGQGEDAVRRLLKTLGIGLVSALGALLLLIGAMWLSPDIRYRVAYFAVEHFDLNSPVSTAEEDAQIRALRRVTLIDANGKTFDWNAQPRAIVWINQWAYWCVPCRMEFPAMRALQARVGKNKLRIVLYSTPNDWKTDKRTARQLGLNFEMVSPKDASAAALKAIDLGVMPNSSFMRANGKTLASIRAPRPWDSAKWESIIRHWYDGGA
jgi:thiol-disulfide isomerase/thioredoxin